MQIKLVVVVVVVVVDSRQKKKGHGGWPSFSKYSMGKKSS